MEIKIVKTPVGDYTLPQIFRYQLCHPGTGFAIYYNDRKFILTAKHLDAPPRPGPAWVGDPNNRIEVKPLHLPITYDATAHRVLSVLHDEIRTAEIFPHASDVKQGDGVVFFGFPRDEEFNMIQTEELQAKEAEIFAIDDYGYYRKFHITPGPQSGFSGSPLFRKESDRLVLIGIVAGKTVHRYADGTNIELDYGYAYSVDKILKDIQASVELEQKSLMRPKRN
jgi:Trypsin-like peptidase domain